MAEMKYIVIELQTKANDTVSNLVFAFNTRNEAESKYHSVLSFAATSDLPMHAASLLQSDGRLLACASYDHTQEPEPEETEVSDE